MNFASDPEKPCPKTLKETLYLFFGGMFMGCADLVPGISGGTMAFILGFYEDLIHSIKSIASAPFHAILRLRFNDFFREIPWQFLLTLLSGILIAMICFSQVISTLLHNELYRTYLYATFFGFVIASTVFCAKQIKDWNWNLFLWLIFGLIIAFLLTQPVTHSAVENVSYSWIMVCGALAVSAMLLPGISGSYLLNILGLYTLVISSFADFVTGLKSGEFNHDAFFVVGSLAIGILIGAIAFSNVVSWLFKHFHNITIAALTGLMIGALRAVWPFQHYRQQIKVVGNGTRSELIPIESYIPKLTDPILWKCLGFTLFGFILVFTLESIGDSLKKSESK